MNEVKKAKMYQYCQQSPLVNLVVDMDIDALAYNVISAIIGFFVLSFLLSFLPLNFGINIGIAASCIWIAIVYRWETLWVTVPSQKGYAYMDMINSKWITVYDQGGHFVKWSAVRQEYVIDFLKQEPICLHSKEKKEIVFPSQNNLNMFAEMTIVFNLRKDADAIGKSLQYPPEKFKDLLRAIIAERLGEAGAINSDATMRYYRKDVAQWIALLFEGEDTTSDFEKATGYDVHNPVLENLDLTTDSKESTVARARAEIITEAAKTIVGSSTMEYKDAINIARVLEGGENIDERIHTFQGIPGTVTHFSYGSPLGVRSDEKKGQKKK